MTSSRLVGSSVTMWGRICPASSGNPLGKSVRDGVTYVTDINKSLT